MTKSAPSPLTTTIITASISIALTALTTYYMTKTDEDNSPPKSPPKEFQSSKYNAELKVAYSLAMQAGKNIYQHTNTKGTCAKSTLDLSIHTHKSNDLDFATNIDVLNEELIIQGIKSTFPDHDIIGEESTGTGSIAALTDNPTWIIDPIDGTTNFASGFPLCCVSIGFCDGGIPVLGVVYCPNTNEVYTAIKGHGAYRNNIRISSRQTEENKTLSNSIVCFELGYAKKTEYINTMINAIQRLLTHGVRAVKTTGCGVLDLCYVALGKMDVVYTGLTEEGWKPWDYCAGSVIVSESGAVMEALFGADGKHFDIYSKNMICAVDSDLLRECREVVLRDTGL